jgi:hypothetical protein
MFLVVGKSNHQQKMRSGTVVVSLIFSVVVWADTVPNQCPWTEFACFDVINSSLCISQNAAKGDATAIAKCVEYDGAMSSLSGAAKVSLSRESRIKNQTKLISRSSSVDALVVIRHRSTTS